MRRLAAAMLLTAGGVLLTAPFADAAEVSDSGWWAKPDDSPLAGLGVDAVTGGTQVPDGQLVVEGAEDGASAVAAVRFTLAAGEADPVLTVGVAEGSSLSIESVVLACSTDGAWTPPETNPGTWEQRPVADASSCATGAFVDDGAAIEFDLRSLVEDGAVDIAVVPGEGSVFRLQFEAPTAGSLRVAHAVVAPAASTSPTTRPTAAPTVTTRPALPASIAGVPRSATGFGPVASPATPATGASTQVAAAPLEGGTGSPIAAFGQPAAPSLGDGDGAATGFGVVLLLLGGAAAAWSYLSPSTGDGMVGLGRFRRPVRPSDELVAVASEGEPAVEMVGLGRFRRPMRPEERWGDDAAKAVAAVPGAPAPVMGGLGRFVRPRDEAPVAIQ